MRIGRKLAAVGLTVGGMMMLGLGPVYADVVGTEGPAEAVVAGEASDVTSTTEDAVGTDAAVSLSPLGRVATSVQESVAALVGALGEGEGEPPVGCPPGAPDPLCGGGGDEGDEGDGDGGGDPLDPCELTPDAPGCEDDGGDGGDDGGDGGGDPLDPCEVAPDAPGCEDDGGVTPPDPGDVLCDVTPAACEDPGTEDPGTEDPGNGGDNGNGGNPGNAGGGNGGNGNGGVDAGQGSNGGGAKAEGTVPGSGSGVPTTAVVGCTDPALCSATVLDAEASTYPAAGSATRNRALPETGSSSTNLPLTLAGVAMLVGGALLMRRRPREAGSRNA